VKITRTDYLLARLAQSAGSLFQTVGDLETALLRRQLDAIPIESPIFVCGLARSGTTILLEELSRVADVGTHRYRDFPFLMTPWLWNRLLDSIGTQPEEVERPHKDRIRITAESPEAFEEPIWQFFFPHVHAADALHRLTGDFTGEGRTDEFEAFFQDHIRKVLLIRGRRRYLSKGNYNVARIEYLAKLFPDARFIIPIRHPFTHVESLVRQHALFSDYARHDPRVPHYLRAAGHYEFGPQRVPIRLTYESGGRIRQAWQCGDDAAGYAVQWAEIYRFVEELRSSRSDLAERILVVRYEDLCDRPHEVIARIFEHAGLEALAPIGAAAFPHIAAPRDRGELGPSVDLRETIWHATESIAGLFGYTPTPHDLRENGRLKEPACPAGVALRAA
jgi:hypothetical protein